jgi:hypothetical protein
VKNLKSRQFGVITLLIFSIFVASAGMVAADQVVPAVPGNQGISVQTVRIAEGLVMEQSSLALQISNQSLAPNSSSAMLSPGQIQYTTVYDQSIVAQGGVTTLVKDLTINTKNTVAGQSNVKADTSVTFVTTTDGGNLVGEENLLLDGAGNPTNASDRMICPFAAGDGNVIPAYCNIIQAGSKFDLIIGSVTTSANDRFVGTDATSPVVLNYNINVKPYGTSQGQSPAIGSAMAYVKAHIQEARGWNITKNEDLTYSETSSAQGTITAFNKDIAYQSGKSLLV